MLCLIPDAEKRQRGLIRSGRGERMYVAWSRLDFSLPGKCLSGD
jgi:hypothetical protein